MSGVADRFPVPPLFGSLYSSAILSSAFYGAGCMQTFFYYTHYRDDPLRTRIFVATLWALNTIHEALTIGGIYRYITTGIESRGLYVNGIREIVMQMLFTTLVGIPTQGFFIYRMYIFNGRNIAIPLVWLPLAIYQSVATIIYVVIATESGNAASRAESVEETFSLINAFSVAIFVSGISVAAVVDVVIATSMCILLLRERTRTATFKSTAVLLHRLIIFAVNTGIWTAIFSILAAVLMSTLSSNLIFAVFAVPLCSVYYNTLLANLNARAYLCVDTPTVTTMTMTTTMAQDASRDLVW